MLTKKYFKVKIGDDNGYQIFRVLSFDKKYKRYQKEIIKFIKSEKATDLESETFAPDSLMADWLYQAINTKKPIEKYHAGINYIIEEYSALTEKINKLLSI